MKAPRIGALSEILTFNTLVAGLIIFLCLLIPSGYKAWMNTSAGCVNCHADVKKMKKLKAPWAYVTNETARKESRHAHVECRDCHLGNGRAQDKEDAHKGMLKMLIVSKDGKLLKRELGYPYGISDTGDDRLFALLPKQYRNGEWVPLPVRNILWQDRDPGTFDFDPGIVGKTCGKSGCHPDELKQFKTSVMGRNYRQRTMRTWLAPYGPHNCGPSFADQLPPEIQNKALFDYSNTAAIRKEMNIPFSNEQAREKQKFCNVCHAGCLDCHYSPKASEKNKPLSSRRLPGPSLAEGAHSFTKTPAAENCLGYGRGNTVCHSGAMHSRRGETYIGGDYSVPQGMPSDIHYKKGFECVKCHLMAEGGMGHIERKATCQDCHLEIEEAHSSGVHRKLDCAACHVSELRGYQMTVWGPGSVAEKETPFHKYLYYGVQSPPVLIKDSRGIWMPVKIWPHSLGNVKADVPPSGRMQFRWKNGETWDAYYVMGTFRLRGSGGSFNSLNNNHLLWLEIEQASHPYGKARDCPSCHNSSVQRSFAEWEFLDKGGADPFDGGYTIVADDKGLRIQQLRAKSKIELWPGSKLADFAPWVQLSDKWSMPGDFSIRVDARRYKQYYDLSGKTRDQIKILDARSKSFNKKERLKYLRLKAFALHCPEKGQRELAIEFP